MFENDWQKDSRQCGQNDHLLSNQEKCCQKECLNRKGCQLWQDEVKEDCEHCETVFAKKV